MNKTLPVVVATLSLTASLLSGLLACSSAPPTRKPADATPFEPLAWVELGADSLVSARVITSDDTCPALTLDAATQVTMSLRSAPSEGFAVRVCEAAIPKGTRSAVVAGQQLPLPKSKPRKAMIIGDTGCRVKISGGHSEIQACNDPVEWPFPALIRKEAEVAPDLVVHLGDYYYRESACPPGNAACAGTPFGDNWDSWRADFFEAARPLLRKAPWIFVRGNHELCKRGGQGWFRFLEPGPMQPCVDETAPFLIDTGNAQFVVLDSALAADLKADALQVESYRRQFAAIADMPLRRAWLVTHKPLWVPATVEAGNPRSPMTSFNQTLQAASGNRLPQGISAVLSGHMHTFAELRFEDSRPGQLIIGHGGSSLTPAPVPDPAGFEIAGTRISEGMTSNGFGFFVLEKGKSGPWRGVGYDEAGHSKIRCDSVAKGFRCKESK